jgi:murein DD-endopeptidase MepM/ murein hydrolase activator NlpD
MYRVEYSGLVLASRVVMVCVVGGLASACSSDTMRFSDNAFSNPFSTNPFAAKPGAAETTGSITATPVTGVSAQTLPPPVAVTSQALPLPGVGAAAPRPLSSAPVTGSVAGWVAQGGSSIVLAQGETLRTLSDRYGVPEEALRQVNGLSASQPAPGTRLTIPVYHAGAGRPTAAAMTPKAPEPRLQFTPGKPPIASANAAAAKGIDTATKAIDTKSADAKAAATKAAAEKAAASTALVPKLNAGKTAEAKTTDLKIADAKLAQNKAAQAKAAEVKAAPVKAVEPLATEAKKAEGKTAVEGKAAVEVKNADGKPGATQVPAAYAPAALPADKEDTTGSISGQKSGATTEFRWPARGRVIAGFGTRNGTGNDGINIALPEGTPIKAAEGGVVAYAGNELKGYGNLVLIRHPDGWVSAYAHNSDVKVKRGEQVKRGQVIATSGQTGNVQSPQLHFELRKGSTPVDPMPHLSGG